MTSRTNNQDHRTTVQTECGCMYGRLAWGWWEVRSLDYSTVKIDHWLRIRLTIQDMHSEVVLTLLPGRIAKQKQLLHTW